MLLTIRINASFLDIYERRRIEDSILLLSELALVLLLICMQVLIHQVSLGCVKTLAIFGLILHFRLPTRYCRLWGLMNILRLRRLFGLRDFDR